MRRSGTSSVCQALSLLGVSFGESKNLIPPDEHNPEGYWELASLNASHRIFNSSLNTIHPAVDPLPADWQERPGSPIFVAGAAKALREAKSGVKGVFGWKALEGSQSIPFIEAYSWEADVEPAYLVCVRHPLEVGHSESRANGTPVAQSIGSWMAYTLGALGDAPADRRHVLIVERFRQDPRKSLTPIVSALGLEPSEAQWQAAVASVKAEMMKQPDAAHETPDLMKRLYEIAQAIADQDGTAEERLKDCRREWDSIRECIERPAITEAPLRASWTRGAETKRLEIPYRVQQSWMTLRIDSTVLPGSELAVGIYPAPALIWLKSAIWKAGEQEWPAAATPGTKCRMGEQCGMRVGLVLGAPDQFRFTAPAAKGPFTLELEILVQLSGQITSDAISILG